MRKLVLTLLSVVLVPCLVAVARAEEISFQDVLKRFNADTAEQGVELAAVESVGAKKEASDTGEQDEVSLAAYLQETILDRVPALDSDPAYDSYLDPCCDTGCCGGCDSCCPTWFVGLDALFLQRDTAVGDRLPIGGGGPVSKGYQAFEVYGGQNYGIDFDTETGWRLSARRCLRSGYEIDFSYMNFDTTGMSPRYPSEPYSIAKAVTVAVPHVVQTPEGEETVWELMEMEARSPFVQKYSSNLDSAEVNLQRPLGPSTKLLAGFRWIRLNEQLTELRNTVLPVPAAEAIGDDPLMLEPYLGVATKNNMYGFQIGAQTLLGEHLGGRLTWHGGLKAGIYGNHSEYRVTLPYPYNAGKDTDISFCGEVVLTGDLRLTKSWSVRAGYQFLWLTGVALASEQQPLPLPPFQSPANDDLFYHGALVGVEYRR